MEYVMRKLWIAIALSVVELFVAIAIQAIQLAAAYARGELRAEKVVNGDCIISSPVWIKIQAPSGMENIVLCF